MLVGCSVRENGRLTWNTVGAERKTVRSSWVLKV